MNKYYIIIIVFLININICINDFNFMDWGLKNKIELSHLIEVSTNKDVKKFIAREDIEMKKDLLKIPYDATFNVEKVLNLLNSNELKLQYELFKKTNITKYGRKDINLQKEEIFLSYILYLVKHESEIYNTTEFYQKYKTYLSSLDKYLPRSPLFFTNDQIEYLQGTNLGCFHNKIKKIFEEEIKIFGSESYYNKSIEYKDYVHMRLIIENKGLEVLGHTNMIPFLNYFDRDYMRYNAKYVVDKNGDVKIISTKLIKKGEIIIVRSVRRTNVERILFEGELNNNYISYKEDYIIPAFSPGLYYKYDIDDLELYNTYYINLIGKHFDLNALSLYKNFSKLFEGDEGNAWAYTVMLENIMFYKEYVDTFKQARINKIFNNFDDRILIEKAMKGEAKLLLKSSEYVKNKLQHLIIIEKQDKERKKKNSDL